MSETPDDPAATSPRRYSLAASFGLSTLKLGLIAGLVLLLLVPQFMVGELVAEREGRQAEVRQEIGAAWGQAQTVLGPVLVVPYRAPDNTRRLAALPPAALTASARLAPERRRRGLFGVVVYTAQVEQAARFVIGDALPAHEEMFWSEAYLLTGASDLRLTSAAPTLSWGGRALTPASEGSQRCGAMETQRWPLNLTRPPAAEAEFAVAGALELRGTDSFSFRPVARQARFTIAGAWDSPSYFGADLPMRSALEDGRFSAEWRGGMAARLIGMADSHCSTQIATAGGMGVSLLEAVPTYRMVNRAAKYAMMFVTLAFLTYLLFELVVGVRIHIVQYALLGASVVLFPLLLLAIAEVAGFALAYAIATAMVMGQASLYTATVTGARVLAGVFALVLGVLFGFLYVVLSLESFALLAGAVALFAGLSVVMLATRRVSWGGGQASA